MRTVLMPLSHVHPSIGTTGSQHELLEAVSPSGSTLDGERMLASVRSSPGRSLCWLSGPRARCHRAAHSHRSLAVPLRYLTRTWPQRCPLRMDCWGLPARWDVPVRPTRWVVVLRRGTSHCGLAGYDHLVFGDCGRCLF